MIRQCNNCQEIKTISSFSYRKDRNSYRYECIKCQKDRLKNYRINNKVLLKEKAINKYINQKDAILANKKQYYIKNKESILSSKKKNRSKIAKYQLQRRKIDIQYKLTISLRDRLNKAISNDQKAGSAVRDLGCSIEQFKKHLESKFEPGMTWDNWTHNGWHIDHIRPLCSFDLTDPEQFKEACHYTNLQPLWAKDNLSKGARYVL